MATFTQAAGSRTSVDSLGTLASGAYKTLAVLDLGATIPPGLTLEMECIPNGAPALNKQLVLFAMLSIDGTNYGTGGTLNDEPQMHWIGSLPTYTTGVTHRKFFSLDGLPVTRYLKLVVKNDMGVALTSGNVYYSAITGVST